MNVVFATLSTYVATVLITHSYAFAWLREWVRDILNLFSVTRKHFVQYYDFISCRLCVSFYVSIPIAILAGLSPLEWAASYGGSYFLATQERDDDSGDD